MQLSAAPKGPLAGQPAPQVLMCHFTCSYWQAWQSVCLFEFLTLMKNKGMPLHLFLVLSVFSSWSPSLLLSNSYPLQFTWRVCGPVPLYLHVRGGCVSSWTVCLNLKQPRDTMLICRWQLYCLRRHNTPPLNATPLGLPKHLFPISLFPLMSVCVRTSGTTGSCQHACSLLGTCLHSSSVAVLQHLTTGTASKNQLPCLRDEAAFLQ